MSTLTPQDANVDLARVNSAQSLSLSNTDRTSQPAREALPTDGYSNLNIDIPLDTRSSLSMELTHHGMVVELVARFESFTGDADSDASQAHQSRDRARTYSNSRDHTLRGGDGPFTSGIEESDDTVIKLPTSRTGQTKDPSPRKSLPSHWKTTVPQGPVFQTELRQERRERRKATFLTKDAVDAVDNDITPASGSSSPTKLTRRHSRVGLKTPIGSPIRGSPQQSATIKLTLSPTRSPRSNVQNQERTPSVTPSAISNQGTEYHSAHSPVSRTPSRCLSKTSSRESFYSANDQGPEPHLTTTPDEQQYTDQQHRRQSRHLLLPIPSLSLSNADDFEKTTGTGGPLSQPILHSRSKTESRATGSILRAAVPNLTLRIPNAATQLSNRKPPFATGSTTGRNSTSPVSPTKPCSRIPRIAPTFDASTKASSLKRSQSSKSLKDTKAFSTTRSAHTTVPVKKLGYVAKLWSKYYSVDH